MDCIYCILCCRKLLYIADCAITLYKLYLTGFELDDDDMLDMLDMLDRLILFLCLPQNMPYLHLLIHCVFECLFLYALHNSILSKIHLYFYKIFYFMF